MKGAVYYVVVVSQETGTERNKKNRGRRACEGSCLLCGGSIAGIKNVPFPIFGKGTFCCPWDLPTRWAAKSRN